MSAGPRDWLAPQFAQQDPRESFLHWCGRIPKQVGNTNFQFAVAQANEAVCVSELTEFQPDRRDRRSRTDRPKDPAPDLLRTLKEESALERRLHFFSILTRYLRAFGGSAAVTSSLEESCPKPG